jgi:hypothetical protein
MTSNAEKSDGSAVPLPGDLLRHRVDDERHVVGHDVDDGLRRTEPVLLEIRGVHPHRGCTRRSIEREDQVRHRGVVRVVHVPSREVAAGDVPAVLPDERLEEPLLLRGQPLLGVPPDLVDDLGSVAGRDGWHGNPLRPRHSALLGGVRQGAADRYPRRACARRGGRGTDYGARTASRKSGRIASCTIGQMGFMAGEDEVGLRTNSPLRHGDPGVSAGQEPEVSC